MNTIRFTYTVEGRQRAGLQYAGLWVHAHRVVKPVSHLIRDAVAEYLDRRQEPGEASPEHTGKPVGGGQARRRVGTAPDPHSGVVATDPSGN
jgi:hypothetical protein